MRILHVTTYLQGGAGRAITDLALAQHARGDAVMVVATRDAAGPGYGNYEEYVGRLDASGVPLRLVDSTFTRALPQLLHAATDVAGALDGRPDIVRLHGRGRFVTLYDEEFDDLLARFDGGLDETRGARAVVVVDVERVSDSCGYGVPLMDYRGERDLLAPFMERKGAEGRAAYRRLKNRTSIDGLPAFDMDPEPEAAPNG